MSLSHDESPLEGPIPSPASNTPINPEPPGARPRQPRVLLPLLLFAITCWTTTRVGTEVVGNGLMYSVPLLTILVCHEFGHYLQARRYGVPASLPYFIPLPSPPLGTMGAVIGMRGDSWNRKELFDIGISGPLAGLVPALIFSVIGLQQSTVVAGHAHGELMLGAPLLFRWLIQAIWGTLPPEGGIELHPMAYAGWVGVFITGLNLIPISQLDGGHVLYALLRRMSYPVTSMLLALAIGAMLLTQSYQWALMLFLLVLIGPNHPPTADDNVPLGTGRIVLGWLTLAFVLIGFTPRPFMG